MLDMRNLTYQCTDDTVMPYPSGILSLARPETNDRDGGLIITKRNLIEEYHHSLPLWQQFE